MTTLDWIIFTAVWLIPVALLLYKNHLDKRFLKWQIEDQENFAKFVKEMKDTNASKRGGS